MFALILSVLSAGAIAQSFSSKPLRIVVRAPPGGTDDLLALLVASKTPREIVMRLADATAKVVASPEYRERVINAGMEPIANTPEQMLEVAKVDAAKIEKIVRSARIKLE